MLPSLSLGPPELSASWSPAFGPWGMPFLVAPDELPDEPLVFVAAGAELAEDPEELEPHAATARATSTSARGASRRTLKCVFEFMDCSFDTFGKRLPLPL